MNKFTVFSDSSSDLTEDLKKSLDVKIIPFLVSFNQKDYLKENIDISIEEFYNKLCTEKEIPKTSLPSVQDYVDNFKKYLEKGQNILCICISSKLSGSFQSAINAKNILEEEFPSQKIFILDSYQATLGQGLLVLQACEMRDRDFSIEEAYNSLEKIKNTANIYFFLESLEYLQKGGRIGKAKSIASDFLKIKPILYIQDGEVNVKSKVRGKKKAISEIVNIIQNITVDKINEYDICVVNSGSKKDTLILLNSLEEKLGIKIKYPIFNAGIAVSAHCGPSAIGVAIIKKHNYS